MGVRDDSGFDVSGDGIQRVVMGLADVPGAGYGFLS
jgi:hypothetical protein